MTQKKPTSRSASSFDWSNKTILVTGGTGSFGRKCIEILFKEYRPEKVIVFSRDELKQHEMQTSGYTDPRLRYFIGDVRDVERLRRAFRGVDVVIHAAALKQVPSCEYNPMEAIQTNVIGTRNVIDAALDCGISHVISLSTDKAVNPVNLYGATKLCAEKLMAQSNAYAGTSGTKFSCVRYGNVVGSRGSVIPIFLKQRDSGKLTLTDERMSRFWITLEQGVYFVLGCIEVMRGGEVFVPKIPSMRLADLARAIAPNCKMELVGIRPGEKLHEILLAEDEARHAIELENMYVIEPVHPWWRDPQHPNAKRPSEGFSYASNNNEWWLSLDELRQLAGLSVAEKDAA